MKDYSKVFIPLIYIGVVTFMVMITLFVVNRVNVFLKEDKLYNYALHDVFEDDIIPVMKTENDSIVRPYIDNNVKIGRYFYDYESNNQKQEDSLIYFENTYLQNTGVDYVNSESFDVVSVLDGEIIGIEDSEIYKKIVTVKHSDSLVTIYSNLENVVVDVGYKISQGEIIATSTASSVSDDNSMLHFEVMFKGDYIDPENLYTLKVSDIQ